MTLFIRMGLYFLFSSIGTISWLTWDPVAGVLSVHADGLAVTLPSYLAFLATFAVSRIAKRRGGAT